MPPPNLYKNQTFKDSWHQAEVGGTPRLKLLPLYLEGFQPKPQPNCYKNRIFKDSWHQAEVGGTPRLKLLPLIFNRPSADAVAQCL